MGLSAELNLTRYVLLVNTFLECCFIYELSAALNKPLHTTQYEPWRNIFTGEGRKNN